VTTTSRHLTYLTWQTITAKVVDSLTGVYVVSYTPHKAGTYQVRIASS